MALTAAASVIPFFTKGVNTGVLLPQGAVAQFTGIIKLGTNIFSKLKGIVSLSDLLNMKKIYPIGPVGPIKGLI
jgi:hypothetical protein